MNEARRLEIQQRWAAIDRELTAIADCRVSPGTTDPAKKEAELLEEQDALEYKLGLEYFRRRDQGEV